MQLRVSPKQLSTQKKPAATTLHLGGEDSPRNDKLLYSVHLDDRSDAEWMPPGDILDDLLELSSPATRIGIRSSVDH